MQPHLRFLLIASLFCCSGPLRAQTRTDAPKPALSWTFDELKEDSYSEASGPEFSARTAGVTAAGGHRGNAAQFDGQTSKMDISGPWARKFGNGFTVSVWAKPLPATSDAYGTIIGNNAHKGFAIRTVYGGKHFSFSGTREWNIARFDLKDKGAKWWHLVLSCAAGKVQVYVDGALVGERDEPEVRAELKSLTTLGYRPVDNKGLFTNGEYYKGLIDDLQVFDRALGGDEVLALFEAQKG